MVTEQSAYPPNHYIKRVPQRKMHIFTGCQVFSFHVFAILLDPTISYFQLVQLLVLCVFGFTPWPYIKMIFPVVLALFLPVRSDQGNDEALKYSTIATLLKASIGIGFYWLAIILPSMYLSIKGTWCYPSCWRRSILPALTRCDFKEEQN